MKMIQFFSLPSPTEYHFTNAQPIVYAFFSHGPILLRLLLVCKLLHYIMNSFDSAVDLGSSELSSSNHQALVF